MITWVYYASNAWIIVLKILKADDKSQIFIKIP